MRKKKTANRNFLGGPYANFPYRVSRIFPIGLQTIPLSRGLFLVAKWRLLHGCRQAN